MKKYITYEDPLQGRIFTEKQMHEIYRDLTDKTEYPDFEGWFTDMLRSGVFEEVQAWKRGTRIRRKQTNKHNEASGQAVVFNYNLPIGSNATL